MIDSKLAYSNTQDRVTTAAPRVLPIDAMIARAKAARATEQAKLDLAKATPNYSSVFGVSIPTEATPVRRPRRRRPLVFPVTVTYKEATRNV